MAARCRNGNSKYLSPNFFSIANIGIPGLTISTSGHRFKIFCTWSLHEKYLSIPEPVLKYSSYWSCARLFMSSSARCRSFSVNASRGVYLARVVLYTLRPLAARIDRPYPRTGGQRRARRTRRVRGRPLAAQLPATQYPAHFFCSTLSNSASCAQPYYGKEPRSQRCVCIAEVPVFVNYLLFSPPTIPCLGTRQHGNIKPSVV
jgi:hypothetical protein